MLGPWKTFLKLIKFKLTKVCNQINFTVGFCDEIEETFLQLIKFRLQKVCNQISFAVCFCDIGTIWTWKNICHALWSWKSVSSLIISLDGLVWTWHNYKYLSIIQLWYVSTRCLMVSTDQADPSCFNFRISWIFMERRWFYFFCPLHLLQGLRSNNIK